MTGFPHHEDLGVLRTRWLVVHSKRRLRLRAQFSPRGFFTPEI